MKNNFLKNSKALKKYLGIKIKRIFNFICYRGSSFSYNNRYNIGLLFILGLSFFLNIAKANFGLPYLHYWDEPAMMGPVLHALKTGNLNQYAFCGPGLYGGIIFWIMLFVSFIHYVGLAAVGALQTAVEIQIGTEADWAWFISHPSFYFVGRLVLCVLGTMSVFVLYKVGTSIYNRIIGLVAAFFLATLFIFCDYSHILTPYIPMTLMVLLTMLFILKYLDRPTWENLIYTGVFIACASSLRFNFFLLIIPAVVAIIWNNSKHKFSRINILILISIGIELIINYPQLISFKEFVQYAGTYVYHAVFLGNAGCESPGLPQFIYYIKLFEYWFHLKILGIPAIYYIFVGLPLFFSRENIKKNSIYFGTFIILFYPFINIKYNYPKCVIFLSPFIALLIAMGLYNAGRILIRLFKYLVNRINIVKRRKIILAVSIGIMLIVSISLLLYPKKTINCLFSSHTDKIVKRIKSMYLHITNYKESRTAGMYWVAEQARGMDKIAIAKELRIHEYDRRLIQLKQVADFTKSVEFQKLQRKDLVDPTDNYILRKLQKSPEFVYKRPDMVLIFLKTNKINVQFPELVEKAAKDMTWEWVVDNSIDYLVTYNAIGDWNTEEFEKYQLDNISPVMTFGEKRLNRDVFTEEPKVNIYKIEK